MSTIFGVLIGSALLMHQAAMCVLLYKTYKNSAYNEIYGSIDKIYHRL